jgi:hypothetical protein
MTLPKFAAVLFGALLASVPASADIVRWGGIYAGPANGPSGYAGPTWYGYPGKTYLSVKGKSELRAADEFVLGAFAFKRKDVHSFLLTEPAPLVEPQLHLVAPRLFPGASKPFPGR